MENKIIFPLSEEDQDKYYDHSAIDRTNDTAFDIYKIDNTYYDVLGNKVNQDGSELKEGKLEEASSNEPDEIKEIRKFFDDLIKEKGVSPDELLDNGAIYYMNGNDGTDFDWQCNKRTCEFMVFYKESKLGFAKVSIDTEGNLSGYYWSDEGHGEGEYVSLPAVSFYPDAFVVLCYEQSDCLGKYDEPIDNINWSAKIEHTWYDWLYDEEEEDDWDDWMEEEDEDEYDDYDDEEEDY